MMVGTDIEGRIHEWELRALQDYREGRAEAPVIYRATGSVLDAEGDRPMTFVASEESDDRFGDILTASGWELVNFEKNPIFLFSHDYMRPPLGTFHRTWIDNKQLLAVPRWDEEDPFAREIKGKYERKVMRAVSVGFRALEFHERDTVGVGGRPGLEFTKQELLEISAVAIPAHPAALARALLYEPRFTIVMPGIPTLKVDASQEPAAQKDVHEHVAKLKELMQQMMGVMDDMEKESGGAATEAKTMERIGGAVSEFLKSLKEGRTNGRD